jgi:Protein of unknown function (DUF3667)
MSHSKFLHPNCLNCHYPLAEFDKFCPNCGQKPVAPKSTMHDLWHEFIHTFFHLDGKFFSTLTHLFIPGKLTEEYFRGHHKRYAHPIQLFLVLGGLFLFVIMSLTSKGESKLQKQLDKQQTQLKTRRIFAKMDSSAQQMSAYKNDPSVKTAIDSLLKKQMFDFENAQRQSSGPSDLGTEYTRNKEKLFAQKLKLARFERQFNLELSQNKDKGLIQLLQEYKTERAQFEADSAEIVADYAKTQKLNAFAALRSLESRYEGLVFGKGIRGEGKTGKAWLNKIEESVAEDIEEDVTYIRDTSAHSNRVKVSFTFGKGLESQREDNRRKNIGGGKNADALLKKKDSITLMTLKISSNDMLDLDADEIVAKYKVEGFMKQRFIKRSVLAIQEGGSMLHTFLSKFLWIVIASLLPLAGVMQLLYWRQKRYFSEHLVWLLHYHALAFIITPPLLFLDFSHDNATVFAVIVPLIFVSTVAPYFAMKRYYKQSWGKTIVKGTLFQFAYIFIGLFVTVIAGFISFLFL